MSKIINYIQHTIFMVFLKSKLNSYLSRIVNFSSGVIWAELDLSPLRPVVNSFYVLIIENTLNVWINSCVGEIDLGIYVYTECVNSLWSLMISFHAKDFISSIPILFCSVRTTIKKVSCKNNLFLFRTRRRVQVIHL